MRTPVHQKPLVQTPAVGELGRPRLKCNRIANKSGKVLVIQPSDRLLIRLHANRYTVLSSTRLAFSLTSIATSTLAVILNHDPEYETTHLCHLTYPLLIIRISPCLKFVPCHFNVSAISSMGISCLETGLGAFPFFSSYHLTQSHNTPRPTIPPFSHQLCVPFVSVVPASSCVSPL